MFCFQISGICILCEWFGGNGGCASSFTSKNFSIHSPFPAFTSFVWTWYVRNGSYLVGTAPNLVGTVLNLVGTVPDLAVACPNLAGVTPKTAGGILNLMGTVFNLVGTVPNCLKSP